MASPDIVCDLVLLSWNHLEETKPCLESLFTNSIVPCRLFIVDNGSAPEVRAYLQSVRPQGAIREIVLLQNETNEGFPKGMNRGIRASSAPYVCILNNDLLFAEGWLKEMIDLVQRHPEIGVVNPRSSTFGDYPADGESVPAYAQRSRAYQQGDYTEVGMCIGFCMLMTRAVLGRLGGLSEEVDRIFFEDEDFCMRAQEAGFRCVVAHGSYVYHAEHKTVRKMPEREALFARNRDWCNQRWGRRVRVLWPRFEPLPPGSAELRRWLEQLLTLARKRAHVYAYLGAGPDFNAQELFASVGLVPHADIQWHGSPAFLVPLHAFWRLVTRSRKKPFDVIVAASSGWQQMARSLQWWHRADVVAPQEEAILAACQRRSRLPLSS